MNKFHSAEEALLWFGRSAHFTGIPHTSARRGETNIPRPCEPGEILAAIKGLACAGRLTKKQVLLLWRASTTEDFSPTKEEEPDFISALAALESRLRAKKIVE